MNNCMEQNIFPITEQNNNIILPSIPLADKNWFATGGNARFFCEPQSPHEFQYALQYAHKHNLALFILGQGANSLISDDGFDGLVIRPQLSNITITEYDTDHVLVTAQAGVVLDTLIEFCLNNNILGFEEFSGIPGTVGGSVYINLHYFEFLLQQFLISGDIIHKQTGTIHTVDVHWFNFGYNDSQLHKKDHFLVNATFKLKRGTDHDIIFARGRKQEIMRHRAQRYPQRNTCGSFFRNFFEHEITAPINEKKIIFVAYYLDKVGVKGNLQIGDAYVSHQHANMIVNRGNATTSDIINLAREMQERVYNTFKIIPQPECQLVGFKDYPLMKT